MRKKSSRFLKPRSEKNRPELTRLPRLTRGRLAFRKFLHWMALLLVRLSTRTEVHGLENFPQAGPALVVANHLGDADVLVGLAFLPNQIDALGKVELHDYPILGAIMNAYGMIWIHRGQPDLRALHVALDGLKQGRMIGIAPEGRESVTGSLEEGTEGAAFLALQSHAPVLPITLTGTENARIYPNLKRLRRTRVSMTIGPVFKLEEAASKQPNDRREAIRKGTQQIMSILASQLPPEYRGVYGREVSEQRNDL
jgi:1-acyl-sn-glycerol-3-phosphate acyltransferase